MLRYPGGTASREATMPGGNSTFSAKAFAISRGGRRKAFARGTRDKRTRRGWVFGVLKGREILFTRAKEMEAAASFPLGRHEWKSGQWTRFKPVWRVV
jgi:hypothetical protein